MAPTSASERERLKSLGLWHGRWVEHFQDYNRRLITGLIKKRCGLTVKGQACLESLRQCILAPTHFSHLDYLAVLAGAPRALVQRTYVAAARDYFYRSWWRAWLTNTAAYHNFPFERTRPSSHDYLFLLKLLKAGLSLLMFAQAGRAHDGQVAPFKPTLAMAALESNVPVVPVVVAGSYRVLPPGAKKITPFPITVSFGRPLYPGQGAPPMQTGPWHQRARHFNQLIMQAVRQLWAAESEEKGA